MDASSFIHSRAWRTRSGEDCKGGTAQDLDKTVKTVGVPTFLYLFQSLLTFLSQPESVLGRNYNLFGSRLNGSTAIVSLEIIYN